MGVGNMKTLIRITLLAGITLGCVWGASWIWDFDMKDVSFIIGGIYILIGSTRMVGNTDPTGQKPLDVEQGSSFVRVMMSVAALLILWGIFW